MDYSNVDLEDLIDTLGVCDLKPTYPRVVHTFPSQTEDLVYLEDELIEVPLVLTTRRASLAHPFYHLLQPPKRGKLVRFQLPRCR